VPELRLGIWGVQSSHHSELCVAKLVGSFIVEQVHLIQILDLLRVLILGFNCVIILLAIDDVFVNNESSMVISILTIYCFPASISLAHLSFNPYNL
jgi:hypothetical protein